MVTTPRPLVEPQPYHQMPEIRKKNVPVALSVYYLLQDF